ncbi:MAG: hypothetical protein ABEJ03_02215 [Candidatus Nanohaloarchaea archaeon]
MTEPPETDKFGLKYLTTTQEVAISFVLLVTGFAYVGSALYAVRNMIDVMPATLGMLMLGTAYLFMLESVRELEEEDHFLSAKLGSSAN